jgi:SpoVK/Ycf46/Vps4 family AAA+-type ATPase
MHLDESQIRIIVLRGVCKSKSLISLHMSENHLSAESLYFIREHLKINVEDCKENTKMQHVHALLGQDAQYDEIK